MSNERRASGEGRRGGWFSMLTVGTIVVAAGFAVGIVAGVTWEEPGLVIGWLSGETEGIEWGADEPEVADESSQILDDILATEPPPIDLPDVAAAPPLGVRKAIIRPSPDSPTEPAVRAVAARPPPPAKAIESGGFSVQVGAFAERTAADELSASLRKAGYSVYLSDGKSGARWRVRVGPQATREAADKTAGRLEASRQLPTWVLREDS